MSGLLFEAKPTTGLVASLARWSCVPGGADPAAVPEACALDVAATGVADALLYWWRLGYDEESVSTRPDLDGGGPLSHWRCAACVLRPGLSVSAGDTARLACAVRFGCLEVLSAEVLSSE